MPGMQAEAGRTRRGPRPPCLAGSGRCRPGLPEAATPLTRLFLEKEGLERSVFHASVRSSHSRTGRRLMPLTGGAIVQGTSPGPRAHQECIVNQDAA